MEKQEESEIVFIPTAYPEMEKQWSGGSSVE